VAIWKFLALFDDHDHAEGGADGDGAREEGLDLFRPGGGRDIEIVRLLAEKHVAHAATGKIRLVAGFAKRRTSDGGGGFHGKDASEVSAGY